VLNPDDQRGWEMPRWLEIALSAIGAWIAGLIPKMDDDPKIQFRWRTRIAITAVACIIVSVTSSLQANGLFFGMPGFVTTAGADTIARHERWGLMQVENRLNGRIDKLSALTTQIAKRDFAQDARDVRQRQCKMGKDGDPTIKMQLEADLESDLENYRDLTGRDYIVPPCDAF
jgi:hypothetical protein